MNKTIILILLIAMILISGCSTEITNLDRCIKDCLDTSEYANHSIYWDAYIAKYREYVTNKDEVLDICYNECKPK